jgi:acetoin utilization deacetylase AcuC-like enzyme
MRFGYAEACLRHDTGPRHPESPDRLRAIRRELATRHGVEYVDPGPAPIETIRRVHDDAYVDRLETFCADGGGEWDPDTVAVAATWDAALESAGLAVWAARAALSGAGGRETPFSLGRPPGHHAVAGDAMGFCFLNNVAIAARSAFDGSGSTDAARDDAGRVAIVDWDVHHGNGTQELFFDRGDVLYTSIHERGLYPGTGAIEETGTGAGEGTTCNVPLPAGAGDAAYAAAVDGIVAPLVADFAPDLLLVSAGFDAHGRDPISRMDVSTEGYGLLATRMADFARESDAALAFVLEGGYSLDTLAGGVGTVNEVFDGYEPAEPEGEPDERARDVIGEIRRVHSLG